MKIIKYLLLISIAASLSGCGLFCGGHGDRHDHHAHHEGSGSSSVEPSEE